MEMPRGENAAFISPAAGRSPLAGCLPGHDVSHKLARAEVRVYRNVPVARGRGTLGDIVARRGGLWDGQRSQP